MPHRRPHSASAPGSLMLFGEHAVLHGRRALCAAVDQRMTVTLHPRQDRKVHIKSELGSLDGKLDTLEQVAPFTFLIAALQHNLPPSGCDVDVRSDFSSKVGLGSSAAITVATLAAVRHWQDKPMDLNALFLDARRVIRNVQGRGSGADVAAATYGGIVAYRSDPVELEHLHVAPEISLWYAGYKTPTPEVIRIVDDLRAHSPDLFDRLFDAIDACTGDAIESLRKGEIDQLGRLANIHHGLQVALGTSDSRLAGLVHLLRSQPGIVGSKISGSGIGDCLIGFGAEGASHEDVSAIPATISLQGVHLESH